MPTPERIVSILPAATETCYALGLGERVVGVSHECDFPPAAAKKPTVSRSRVDSSLPSRELDAAVKLIGERGESLYELDAELIASLEPDLVITQVQCEVCAVSPKDLEDGLALCDPKPDLFEMRSLELEDVFQDTYRLGKATGTVQEAEATLLRQWALLKQVRKRVADLPRRRVAVIDWVDPVMFAGHWVPDLVAAAGGRQELTQAGEPSRWGSWDEVRELDPDAILLAPCGRDVAMTRDEWASAVDEHGLDDLAAVREGRVFAADGHSYFNRPGPRLVYSAAILARVLHPEVPELPSRLEEAFTQLEVPA